MLVPLLILIAGVGTGWNRMQQYHDVNETKDSFSTDCFFLFSLSIFYDGPPAAQWRLPKGCGDAQLYDSIQLASQDIPMDGSES